MKHVTVISFGYLHGPAPEAHLTVDLRHHFRDPHVSPELRYMTAWDKEVQNAVLSTDGIEELASGLVDVIVSGFLGGPAGDKPLTVAIGCAGGRHRAPVVADTVASRVSRTRNYTTATLIHRDLDRPVVER